MYPSGAWKGYWEQDGYRGTMHPLEFHFAAGRVTGSGYDVVGRFTFSGTYDDSGHVSMVKHYIGAHQVIYEGTWDGEGTIFGQWTISGVWSGPFALSPDGELNVAELPIMSVGASPDDD